MSHHGDRPEEINNLMKDFKDAQPKLDAKEIHKKITEAGATGRFPHGRITKDDEGEIAMKIESDPDKGVVVIDFGKPIQWFGMTAKEVDGLCELLQKHKTRIQEEKK